MMMMMMMMMMIMVIKAGDSGVYECQVSTSPVMSHQVILNVEGIGITTVRTGYCLHIAGGEPAITENIGNITRALGQEARLKCVVTGLSRGHKVSLCPASLPPSPGSLWHKSRPSLPILMP